MADTILILSSDEEEEAGLLVDSDEEGEDLAPGKRIRSKMEEPEVSERQGPNRKRMRKDDSPGAVDMDVGWDDDELSALLAEADVAEEIFLSSQEVKKAPNADSEDEVMQEAVHSADTAASGIVDPGRVPMATAATSSPAGTAGLAPSSAQPQVKRYRPVESAGKRAPPTTSVPAGRLASSRTAARHAAPAPLGVKASPLIPQMRSRRLSSSYRPAPPAVQGLGAAVQKTGQRPPNYGSSLATTFFDGDVEEEEEEEHCTSAFWCNLLRFFAFVLFFCLIVTALFCFSCFSHVTLPGVSWTAHDCCHTLHWAAPAFFKDPYNGDQLPYPHHNPRPTPTEVPPKAGQRKGDRQGLQADLESVYTKDDGTPRSMEELLEIVEKYCLDHTHPDSHDDQVRLEAPHSLLVHDTIDFMLDCHSLLSITKYHERH